MTEESSALSKCAKISISPHWAHQLGLFSHMELLLPMKQYDLFQQLGWLLTIYSKTWRMLPWPYKGLRHISLSHYSESDLQDSFRRPQLDNWLHFFGNILLPRSWYQNHTPITKKHLKKRYPGGNFQSSDPTWSPRSPCKSIISARAPPWQGKHSNDDLTKKVETCMAKEMAVKSVHFWCDSDVLGKLLDGFFFQFAIEPLWHLVTFALSTSFLILRMFSTDSPRRILNESTGRKKTGLDRRDGGPRTVLDTRWSQQNTQNTRTAWVKAAPHRRQWLPRSLRLHAKCQECPATGGIQETQTRKAHLIGTFFVA